MAIRNFYNFKPSHERPVVRTVRYKILAEGTFWKIQVYTRGYHEKGHIRGHLKKQYNIKRECEGN